MNGAHDLGGMQELGPISAEPEASEPVFHDPWEARVLALTLACGMLGQWNIDQSRDARERQHPVDYLSHSYYENWFAGLRRLLQESGLLTAEEIRSGRADGAPDPAIENRVPAAGEIAGILSRGGPTEMAPENEPRFKTGDRMRVDPARRAGHTRVPGYVRGHHGLIVRHHGAHVFPDDNARGIRHGRHLYNVSFSAADLWGEGRGRAHVDLWQDYLEAAIAEDSHAD